MTRKFVSQNETSNSRSAKAVPQTSEGNKRAFDMRPKASKKPRNEPEAPVQNEPEPKLLDDQKD